jgi:hypothetical protein
MNAMHKKSLQYSVCNPEQFFRQNYFSAGEAAHLKMGVNILFHTCVFFMCFCMEQI